ncbi:putative ribonucleoside-diphosphate reductase alpha subunit [Bacillus phage vB_BspM_MarvelLand]|nr:putative ribonucleoside-diphosphate reductase alpha subunit [Bacillus phage vB_BspM_MarvelLand]
MSIGITDIIRKGAALVEHITTITKDRGSYIQEKPFEPQRFYNFIQGLLDETVEKDRINKDTINEVYSELVDFIQTKKKVEATRLFELIIREINSRVTEKTPELTSFSAAVYRRFLYKQASKLRGFDYKDGYGDYYTFVREQVEAGKYSEQLLEKYTAEELKEIGSLIDPEKDKLFSYSGLYLLSDVYLVKNTNKDVVELPQERFLTAIIYMLQNEDKKLRMQYIKEAYWVISNHLIGLATPTLKNAGTPHGSLSSCHIITMDDDLKSILEVIKQAGRFSQNGSGLGIYLGFLRSHGSWIRGIKGTATGVIHPCRLLSVAAEYVNQTGTRKAGIATYLPVWHADIFGYLELRLKTGSQEKRAHSIKTAVTIPDEFMRRLRDKQNFTIFDPYEVKKKLGIDLNRLYDKKKLQDGEEPNAEDHAFTYYYRMAEQADLELKQTVATKEIYRAIFKSRKTGGAPFMYWSDTAARLNPNGHEGMPYGSNLCTEIIQNMIYDTEVSEEKQEQGYVVTKTIGEGLVTCNLSSQVAHNTYNLSDEDYQRVVDIQYRLLDCVISLNRTPVPQANHTNDLYRAVGGGLLGLVTAMTNEGIPWESPEAAAFTEKVFKRYLKAQIKASHKLAMEKGSYPLFEGSDWATGEFFDKRELVGEEWDELRELAMMGMRNGYLGAVAPTASNAIIVNGSPSADPLYDVMYTENKSGMNVLIVPPNYNNQTKWFYKSGFEMDEMWAINVAAAAQKYVDQAISHNLHMPKSMIGSDLLRIDMAAWEKGLKTIYYTHTEDRVKPEDCVMCEG